MTSVQNPQLPLSGNRFSILGLLVFLGVFLFSSCGTAERTSSRSGNRKVPVERKTYPTKKSDRTTSKVDTIAWNEKKNGNTSPITDKEGGATSLIKEDVYDITYLLPLKALSYASGTVGDSEKFINYFAGMEMAKEVLERERISLNIEVVDSEKRKLSSVLNSSINSQTDAIIGLYETSDLQEAAQYAKEKQVPLISPWKASSKVTSENPYYVQLRPNLDEYYKAMIKDIAENYKPEQVYVLGRNDNRDKKMVKYIQRLGQAYFKTDENTPFTEYEVVEDSLIYGSTAFDSIFSADQTNVVVIPNFSFGDENYIYSTARRLTVEKGLAKMVVYGMEIMLDSDKLTFDHYNALNMKIARTKFVDEADGDVQRFKRRFYEVYGALPTDDAYEGYDNLMFVARNLKKYGKNFQHYLDNDRGHYLQAAYDVQRTFPKGSQSDDYSNINYFENKHVDIITFDGRRFHRSEK